MATLKDVARESGLTVSTVSRVLNNRGYISEDARKKVAAAMKKLNYHPNEVARSLQNKKSNIVAILAPHIKHPYFAEMISGLERAAYDRGYKVFLFNTMGREDMTTEYVNLCNASRVEGIVLCTGNLTKEAMESLNVPIIAVERFIDGCSASVQCDNLDGALQATRRLLDAGCRKLLYIGNAMDLQMPADDRSRSFRQICEETGTDYVIARTNQDVYTHLEYYSNLEEIIDANPEADGIFASSDIIAAQVLQVLNRRGIKVPEQMKIIGFDDVNLASLTTPRLTTVHQPIREMAELAMELLTRAIAGEEQLPSAVLPVRLVERDSV